MSSKYPTWCRPPFQAMLYWSRSCLQEPLCPIYPSEHPFQPHSIIASMGDPYFEKGKLLLNIETWRFSLFRGIHRNRWTKKITQWKVTQAVPWERVSSQRWKWALHRKGKLHGKPGRPSSCHWSRCSIPLFSTSSHSTLFSCAPPPFVNLGTRFLLRGRAITPRVTKTLNHCLNL
jgi:hypothetical protein